MKIEMELTGRQANLISLFLDRLQYEDAKKRITPEAEPEELFSALEVVKEAVR